MVKSRKRRPKRKVPVKKGKTEVAATPPVVPEVLAPRALVPRELRDVSPKLHRDPHAAVGLAIDQLNKKWGKGSARRLGDEIPFRSEVKEVIPSGIPPVDHHCLGIGGLPVGRLVELYSEEGGGKSTLLWWLIGQVQRMGGFGVLAETEHALDRKWVASLGADVNDILLLVPDSMEQAVEMLHDAVLFTRARAPKGGPILAGWDSIAATMLQKEIDEGEAPMGARARLLSTWCKKFGAAAVAARACFLLLNQIRAKIGVKYGANYTTPGGYAVKFHASIRLQIMGGSAFKDDNGDHLGKDFKLICTKNRFHAPFAVAPVRLVYAKGFDALRSTCAFAMDRNVLPARSYGRKNYVKALKALNWPEPDQPSFDIDAPDIIEEEEPPL